MIVEQKLHCSNPVILEKIIFIFPRWKVDFEWVRDKICTFNFETKRTAGWWHLERACETKLLADNLSAKSSLVGKGENIFVMIKTNFRAFEFYKNRYFFIICKLKKYKFFMLEF